jgi:hypothetical protein
MIEPHMYTHETGTARRLGQEGCVHVLLCMHARIWRIDSIDRPPHFDQSQHAPRSAPTNHQSQRTHPENKNREQEPRGPHLLLQHWWVASCVHIYICAAHAPSISNSHDPPPPYIHFIRQTVTGESLWEKPTAPATGSGGGPTQVMHVWYMGWLRVGLNRSTQSIIYWDGASDHPSAHTVYTHTQHTYPPDPNHPPIPCTHPSNTHPHTQKKGPRAAPPQEAPRLPPALLLAPGDYYVLPGGGHGRAAGYVLYVYICVCIHFLGGCEKRSSPSPPHQCIYITTALRDRIVAAGQAGGAEALRQEFEALAKVESDCSSARAGGSLGFFGRGQMQRPFEGGWVNEWLD